MAIENNKIVGVVTDGDVRRAMHDKQDRFFDLTVEEVMSRNPKTISETAKLSEAEKLMRQYNIHSLVVVNDEGQLAGLIDTFSCMI